MGSDEGERQPLLSPLRHDGQGPVQESGVQSISTRLTIAFSQSQDTRCRAHVIHFGDARQWTDDQLSEMLGQMNVEVKYTIPGRLWLNECTRMISRGYKVIVLITKDAVTTCTHFEATLHQIILKQNCRQSCFIPVLFNCTLMDLIFLYQ